jgi:hypothetical protein
VPLVGFGKFDLGGGFYVVPPVDARAGGCGPYVIASRDDLGHAFVLLTYGQGKTLVHVSAIAHIALRYHARSIRRVENVQSRRVGMQ